MPIYGSVDIRDANWKVAVVDANQYPAESLNNLQDGDIGEHFRNAIGDLRHVHIWPEAHTRTQLIMSIYLPSRQSWRVKDML